MGVNDIKKEEIFRDSKNWYLNKIGEAFIDVSGSPVASKNWYLDWEYSTEGSKTITVEVTTDGGPVTKDFTLTGVTVADDMLFSSDDEIISIEPDVLDYLNRMGGRDGRNSFLTVHRPAQTLILDRMNELGFINDDLTRITKDQLVEREDFNKWSKFLTLGLIYNSASNQVDDIFDAKAKKYFSKAADAQHRAIIIVDFDKDGNIDDDEFRNFKSIRFVRR